VAVLRSDDEALVERDAALLQQLPRRDAGLARFRRHVERDRILDCDLAQLERQLGAGLRRRGTAGAERDHLAFVRIGLAIGVCHLAVGADDLELRLAGCYRNQRQRRQRGAWQQAEDAGADMRSHAVSGKARARSESNRGPLREQAGARSQLHTSRGAPCAYRCADSTVLASSMAIVIGPTPPGTGVIAEATSQTPAKSTSPQSLPALGSPSGMWFMPTSMTAPGLTIAAVRVLRRPTAATFTSASRVCPARSGVRLWQMVTVASACKSMSAIGFPTVLLRPMTTACLPRRSMPVLSMSFMQPHGVHGLNPGSPVTSRPALSIE